MKPVITIERMDIVDGTRSPTKAFVDLLILDTFLVKGLRVVQGKDGPFLCMPREQGRDGKWYETFFPVSKEMRKGLEELVLEAYEEKIGKTREADEFERILNEAREADEFERILNEAVENIRR